MIYEPEMLLVCKQIQCLKVLIVLEICHIVLTLGNWLDKMFLCYLPREEK